MREPPDRPEIDLVSKTFALEGFCKCSEQIISTWYCSTCKTGLIVTLLS